MKKRLEADLVSIAHRILQLKNKSDINKLYLETQKLYEKLSVLKFVEEFNASAKPTIGQAEMEKEIEAFYDSNAELPVDTIIEMTESNVFGELTEEEEAAVEKAQKETLEEEKSLETEKTEEEYPEESAKIEEDDSAESTIEEIDQDKEEEINVAEAFEADIQELQIDKDKKQAENDASQQFITKTPHPEDTTADKRPEGKTPPEFKAAFELTEETETDIPKKAETVQISFEDLLGGNYNEPQFVKVDDVEALPAETVFEAMDEIQADEKPEIETKTTKSDNAKSKVVSLNDKLSKGIDIDLNDRIAFVKHLFGNSTEDYNRVLNQLITFDNFYETKNFIEEMVKPDYNNWKGKDDYAERFMDIIEKKFL